jgi:pimeloyl-ACP methyl ester carboxylesterase
MPVEVQPLVLELLLYLVCHRDRVVTKDELLNALWADTNVTEASLSRAISLARRAIDDGDRADPLIRTHTRVGFRFTGEVTETANEPHPGSSGDRALPVQSSYARDGRTHIAYQVVGDGPVDLVVVQGWTLSMQSVWEDPATAAFHRRLAGRCRLILFDKRGTGLSDRVKELPGLAQRMEDLTAVLDAVGSKGAFVLGISEGAPMAILYAASHPERVRGLGLIGGFARMRTDVDQTFGWTDDQVAALDRYIRSDWGEGRSMLASMPSQLGRPGVAEWCARVEQIGASPGAALELWSMNREIDVRDVLPVIETPCLVIHMKDDPVIDVEHGRHLGRSLAGARYVEIDGGDHLPLYGDLADASHDALEQWLERRADEPVVERRLATVLATDLDAATRLAAVRVHQLVVAHRGRAAVDASGRRLLVFDGPALAVRCALSLVELGERAGEPFGAGLACTEVALSPLAGPGDADPLRPVVTVRGPATDAAVALGAQAAGTGVLITRALRELLAGSGIVTTARTGAAPDADGAPAFHARRAQAAAAGA